MRAGRAHGDDGEALAAESEGAADQRSVHALDGNSAAFSG